MRVIPGGMHIHQSPVCPACNGARCHVCNHEGTMEAYQETVYATTLQEELSTVSDAQLSEHAVRHALAFATSFRSPKARYVSSLLREVLRRAGMSE